MRQINFPPLIELQLNQPVKFPVLSVKPTSKSSAGLLIRLMSTLLIISLVALLILITGCSSTQKTEQTKRMMDTEVTITVYDENREIAERAIAKAFSEMERIEALLSGYKNTSQVYLLNKEGRIEGASNELLYVLNESLRYSAISDGAFDITVQPLLDLYKHTFTDLKREPTAEEIKEALDSVGYEAVLIRDRKIEFTKPGVKITLGGIAKGYIVDRAIEVLEKDKIKHALVNAGGDIRAIGNKGNEEWRIALQNPREKNDYIAIIRLNNKSVATSGDYERFFDDAKKFHHIVDPRTGYSASELISVTIVADKAIDADAMATSVFVLGKERGLELLEKMDNVEGMIITREKEIVRSSGFSGD